MERKNKKSAAQNALKDGLENGLNIDGTLKSSHSDKKNMALLLFLYTLQGIPLGLSSAIPMILQNKGATYKQQAEFSFVTWPFSLKLLWAPLVDCWFSKRIGRRKTWLIPTQYLIGLFMLLLSGYVDRWLDAEPHIGLLTLIFFLLNFLAATQDVAVDGWALTILHKSNRGHASTCNSIGQTAGFFLSYIVFMALESPTFCNQYLRTEPLQEGIVSLSGFLFFWGCIFVFTTTVVAFFKKEKPLSASEVRGAGVRKAYSSLCDILALKPVQTLVLILLTCKIGFSPTDSVMTLKLVESGIPKEQLGLMAIPLIPLQLTIPIYLARYTTGTKPLNIFVKAIPYRLLFGLVGAAVVWLTPMLVPSPSADGLPYFYWILLFLCYTLHQICVYSMFVSLMAFFAKISDSTVGGTYMTLLNTVTNLGGNWPGIVALYFVDPLTFKQCQQNGVSLTNNTCSTLAEQTLCTDGGGVCSTWLDGFYIETFVCILIGFVWLKWGTKRIDYVQSLDENAWKLSKRRQK